MPPEDTFKELYGSEFRSLDTEYQIKFSDGFRKYPPNRDAGVLEKSPGLWLESKRIDDGAEGLWRIHDKLYDFTDFVQKHPGGQDWLTITKGMDITEAFEASHVSKAPEMFLCKYYRREARIPRNSLFTFNEDGFYKTLKRRAAPILKKSGTGPTLVARMFQDVLALSFLTVMMTSAVTGSYSLAILAGLLLTFNMNSSHNFVHQADNWRMYLCDLSIQSYWEFRVTHTLSHHLYPNTIADYEVTILEPILEFLPKPKSFLKRFSPIVTVHFTNLWMFYLYLRKLVAICLGNHPFRWYECLTLLELVAMICVCSSPYLAFKLWVTVHLGYGYFFIIIAVTAAHHHPDIYHAGDVHRKDLDWGLHQLDAVKDRKEINSNLLFVMVSFGHHSLHHLFPSVDHSKLSLLYPVLQETCKEFGVDYDYFTIWELVKGSFQQLARTK